MEFNYEFRFKDGGTKKFRILLDDETLTIIPPSRETFPDWTKLDFKRCEICSFSGEICPIAESLIDVVDEFSDVYSTEEVEVVAEIPGRTVSGKMPVQNGLSSLIGIYMAGSACPVTKKLKPMLKTHLPFASIDDTIFRSVSSYLLGQYFIYKYGGTPDWDLKDLIKTYEKIEEVNEKITQRLKSTVKEDANINAIIILDVFAKFIPMTISKSLERLKSLYADWIKEGR